MWSKWFNWKAFSSRDFELPLIPCSVKTHRGLLGVLQRSIIEVGLTLPRLKTPLQRDCYKDCWDEIVKCLEVFPAPVTQEKYYHTTDLGRRMWRSNRARFYFSVIQLCLFVTPWTVARQASLSFTISWSLLKLYVHWIGDAIQPSHPL